MPIMMGVTPRVEEIEAIEALEEDIIAGLDADIMIEGISAGQ